MKKNTKIMIAVIIMTAILIGLVVTVSQYISKNIEAGTDVNVDYFSDKSFDTNDSIMFVNSELGANLEFGYAVRSDSRPVQKLFFYKEDGHTLGILYYTTIQLARDVSLNDAVFLRNEKYTKGENRPSVSLHNVNASIDVPVVAADSIIFSYSGDSNKLQKVEYANDFISYYMTVNHIAIRYGASEPIDIYFKPPVRGFRSNYYPLYFAFLKNRTTIYFMIYRPFEKDWTENISYEVPLDFMGRIVNWRNE